MKLNPLKLWPLVSPKVQEYVVPLWKEALEHPLSLRPRLVDVGVFADAEVP